MPRADGTSAVAKPTPDLDDAGSERLLHEVAAAALLVGRGVATRVVVCNAPATVDFDRIRLVADTFDVRVEPVVRVGGGGFDLAVTREDASGG